MSITISKTLTNKYYASFTTEQEIQDPVVTGNKTGIDLGVKSIITNSNGTKIENPKFLIKAKNKLRRVQRNHSRKQKRSNSREKARILLAKQYEKVTNSRNHFLHNLSLKLVLENQDIFIEDLNIKGMVKNHRLADRINDASWGEFIRQLEYKGKWYGCRIHKIDRFFPSSKTCNNCGWINDELKLSQRVWECSSCKSLLDRDINAAKNILDFGLKMSTVETTGINADGDTAHDSGAASELQ